MALVFISFIHEEVKYAEATQSFISHIWGPEVTPFLSSDRFQIFAGEKWLDRIMSELVGAKVVLLMLSPESVLRPWVNFEAGVASGKEIVIIPVCIRGLNKEKLPIPYSSFQAVNLSSLEDQEYLACSVAHHLGILKQMQEKYSMSFLKKESKEKKAQRERQSLNENIAFASLASNLKSLDKAFENHLNPPERV